MRPNTPWVLTTLLELQTRAADWPGALSTLRIVRKQKVLDSDICNIREAGILLEQARLAGSSGDSNLTSRLAESAYNTKKDFVAAIIFLASHYLSIAQHTKAEKIILQAWNKSPHPSLAKYFNEACAGKDGTSRAKQLKKLAERNRNHPESLLILASVALEAKLWGSARSHLEATLKVRPTVEIYRRLAYLEEVGYDDSKAARKWLLAASEAEADPTWTCKECGISAQEWTIICSFCGTIDTMEWGQTRQNRNLLNASTNLFTEEKENSTSADLARSDNGDVVVPNSDKVKIEMT